MMAKGVGIGVVGLDHWYTAFAVLDEASKRSGMRLVGVSDRSRKRRTEIESKYDVGCVTADAGRLIADPGVDLVCSQVNTRENAAVVRRALKAGKHVACVKPMAMTLRQADALIALAESERRVLWSFDQLGRGRGQARLKSLIKRGAIGQVISFQQTMWAGLPKPWHDRTGPSWWTDAKLVPFGAWADHAIYTIDMVRDLFEADVVAVHGEIGKKRYPKLALEDYGVGTLRFSNGVVAVIEQTWTAGKYYPHWTKIVGTNGVIHMDQAVAGGKPVVVTSRGQKAITMGGGRGGVLDPVLSLIRKKRTKPSAARESRRNLAIAFAVYRAAKTGRYVPV
jgi:predicted dehydrogenase